MKHEKLLKKIGLIMYEMVDTNVLVRFFTEDVAEQADQAEEWFEEAKRGVRKLSVHSVVIAETVYVLESFYKKTREEITDIIMDFLKQEWLIAEDKKILLGLWKWYLKNFHFVDSFLLSWAEANQGKVLSFDKKLGKQS